MADSNAPVEMDLDEDEMTSERTSEHAVAENAAAIGLIKPCLCKAY